VAEFREQLMPMLHIRTAQFFSDGYVSSIRLTHRALLARGVVGYQEVCLDSPSKMAAYLQVFEGSLAYNQPRVRGLLRMRPDNSVAEIQDIMTRLQVCSFWRHPTFFTASDGVAAQQQQRARLTIDGVSILLEHIQDQVTRCG
jgi:hypothetical protein